MNMFNEGDLAFLDYGEVPPCIHCRLIGPHLTGNLYMIVTPDLDIYEEELSDQNPDLAAFYPGLGGLGSYFRRESTGCMSTHFDPCQLSSTRPCCRELGLQQRPIGFSKACLHRAFQLYLLLKPELQVQ